MSMDWIIGKTIKIVKMQGEPSYTGKIGIVKKIDGIGQLFGTWGGLAVQPENDDFEVINEDKKMNNNKEYFIRLIDDGKINLIYSLEQSGTCDFIKFLDANSKGEKMQIEISHNESYGNNSLPHFWYENGYTDKELNKYIVCHCCIELDDGVGVSKYNPQLNKDFKINFDWLLEDVEDNEELLIDEIASRFYKCGKKGR